MGYWTEAAEMWYQRRLADIRSGVQGPKNGREWKRSLSPSRDSKSMMIGLEKSAIAVLAS